MAGTRAGPDSSDVQSRAARPEGPPKLARALLSLSCYCFFILFFFSVFGVGGFEVDEKKRKKKTVRGIEIDKKPKEQKRKKVNAAVGLFAPSFCTKKTHLGHLDDGPGRHAERRDGLGGQVVEARDVLGDGMARFFRAGCRRRRRRKMRSLRRGGGSRDGSVCSVTRHRCLELSMERRQWLGKRAEKEQKEEWTRARVSFFLFLFFFFFDGFGRRRRRPRCFF